MDERIKKMWYIDTVQYYLATNKHDFLAFAAKWTALEGIMLSKQRQKLKSQVVFHTWRKEKRKEGRQKKVVLNIK